MLAAAGAFGAAWLVPGPGLRTGTATTGGLLVVAALGGVLRVPLPSEWAVLGYLACGIGLLALVRGSLPEPVRHGLGRASAAVQGIALLWTLPVVVTTLFGPAAWVSHIWSGAPDDARAAATMDIPWPTHETTAPLVLVAVAAVLTLAVRSTAWRPRALAAALTLAWMTAMITPTGLQLPYTIGLLVDGLIVVALLSLTHRIATALALGTSLVLAALSLASEPATLAVLASLTALLAGAAWRGRLAPVSMRLLPGVRNCPGLRGGFGPRLAAAAHRAAGARRTGNGRAARRAPHRSGDDAGGRDLGRRRGPAGDRPRWC